MNKLNLYNKFNQLIFLSLLFLIFSCKRSNEVDINPNNIVELKLISSHSLNVPKPSGLTMGSNGNELWTVSDKPTNKIYQLDLEGNVITTLPYSGDDLEGITYSKYDNTLWVVEEGLSEVVHIRTDGSVIQRYHLGLGETPNKGLEGISILPNKNIVVLNEKSPGLLVELNSEFTIVNIVYLDFAKDYSGVCFDEIRDKYWILSDENKRLFLWDQENGVSTEFFIDCPQPEGIAVDYENNLVYIVSDSSEKLYVFKIDK